MDNTTEILRRAEKVCKLAKKYKLKTIEVSENTVKIEFNEVVSVKREKRLTKNQLDFLKIEKERNVMDEMQIMDPAAYEEMLAQGSATLKEI